MAKDRLLILLRHAKSDWPPGVDDLDRPLAERGLADAAVAGTVLAGVAVPEVVLCSPAQRTRQTWHLVQQALDAPPEARFEPVIYGAEVEEILELVRSVPAQVRTVLVIGHEPTMSRTASTLAGPGSSPDDLARLETKYPTAGMAVLRSDDGWAGLRPAGAVLERFLVPRG